jgi:hypothetical protein
MDATDLEWAFLERHSGCPQRRTTGCDVASNSPLNRDRIAATIITVAVHALLIAALVEGGAKVRSSVRDAARGDGQDTTVAVEFLARQEQASPKPPAVVETTPRPPLIAEPSIPEPAGTIAQPSNPASDAASSGSANEDVPQGGAGAPPDELGARYLAAVRAAIVREWNAQGGGEIPSGCAVVFDQADGGRPLRAWVMHCGSLSAIERARLETAVMQAQPLPYAGFEPVFQAHLKLTF